MGSSIEVYLERIESFKGEIIISRDKARKMKAWKKLEKLFDTQDEMTGYITGRVKGGFITTIDEAFVAGPAIKNTKTAPADTPLAIRTKAIGIDAVAQT